MIKYKLIATVGISLIFAINASSEISMNYRDSELVGAKSTIKQSSVKSSSFDESKAPFIPPGWRYPRYNAIGHSCLKAGSTVRTGNEMKLVKTISDVSSILTGDVDGDGKLEMVTVNASEGSLGNTLKIYGSDGSIKRSVTLPLSQCRVTMLEDVDNDGAMEIFIGSGYASQISAYIYNGNGTLLKEFRNQHIGWYDDMQIYPIAFSNGKLIVLYTCGWAFVPRGLGAFDYTTGAELWYYQIGPITGISSIDDMDRDGLLDITLSTGTVHNGVTGNGTTDGDCYVIVVNENGVGKLTTKYSSPSDGDAEGLFADINGDGKSEIIGFKGFNQRYYSGQSRIQIFDRSGNVLKTFYGPQNRTFKGNSWIMGSFAVGDLDGNGALEIVTTAITEDTTPNVTTTFVLDTNLNKIAESNVDGEVRFIGDINGDGNMEVVIISQSGILRILDRNLNQLSEIKVGDKSGEVIASDLDGDGRIELLCRNDQLYILGFSDPVFKLQVSSTNPTNGVVITSSTGHAGTTEYSLDIPQNSTVNLQAPLYIGSLNNRKRFSNWSGSITSTNLSVNFLLNWDKAVTANYVDDPETKILRVVGDLTFDSVPVGGNRVKTITIWNDGNSVLTVTSIDCPQGFSATPQSFILSPGSSQAVEVTFAPTSSGINLGLFIINSDKTSGNNTLVCFGQVGCSYSLSSQNWSAPAAGGSVNITVNCANGCSWNVSNPCSEWVTVNPLNGNGSGVVTITVAQNSTGSQRDCVLTIAGQSFQINQSAAENLVVATQGGSRYSIPGTNTIYCSFAYPAGRQIYSLIWRPILPPHFILLDAQGDGDPVVFNDEIVFINFTGSNPITFSYQVAVSEQSAPTNQLQAEVEYMLNGMINSETIYASPNPLIIREISLNSADYRSLGH
ncbi:MAG: BACON domain-containing protein [Verrucomicrobiia bacterium]